MHLFKPGEKFGEKFKIRRICQIHFSVYIDRVWVKTLYKLDELLTGHLQNKMQKSVFSMTNPSELKGSLNNH